MNNSCNNMVGWVTTTLEKTAYRAFRRSQIESKVHPALFDCSTLLYIWQCTLCTCHANRGSSSAHCCCHHISSFSSLFSLKGWESIHKSRKVALTWYFVFSFGLQHSAKKLYRTVFSLVRTVFKSLTKCQAIKNKRKQDIKCTPKLHTFLIQVI